MNINLKKAALLLGTTSVVLVGCGKAKKIDEYSDDSLKDSEYEQKVITIEKEILENNKEQVIEKEVKEYKDVDISFYLRNDSNIYDEDGNIIISEKQYQYGFATRDYGDKYLAVINDTAGYIDKSNIAELSGTYVVADITDQKLDIYEDDKIVMSSPIVSGKDKTPSTIGAFEIYDITRNRYLIGDTYRTWVDVMMKYNGGEGLHDAEYHTDYDENGNIIKQHGWRNLEDFGGETYHEKGSLGCLNMPHDKALEAFDILDYGDKVLVKE